MINAAAGSSEMEQSSLSTRRTNVYRMYRSDNLHELLSLKIRENVEGRFSIRTIEVGSSPALLVSGESGSGPVEWTETVRSLTGIDLGFTTTAASAALFIDVDGAYYTLAFGQGWRYMREGKVDRQFGIDVGVRMLDPDEIKDVTRWALSAKSRVDRNMVPGGQGLWAFGLREHAELVRSLSGKAHDNLPIDLTYVRRRGKYRNFRLSVECGEGLHIHLGITGDSLVSDLRELTRIVDEVEVNPQLEPLQWVRRLGPNHDMRELLDSEAVDLLADPDVTRGEVGIAYPSRYYDGPTVQRYSGNIGDFRIDTEELSIEKIRIGVRQRPKNEYLRTLRSSTIEGLDGSGASLGGEVSALHWIAAEIVDPDYHYILLDGDWYSLGDQYLRHVDRVVKSAFKEQPPWTLPAWNSTPLNERRKIYEKDYNENVPKLDGRFLCLDRKLVKTRVHPQGFEVCDLLGPNDELIHVKKVSSDTGSSVLSHLFAQGLVAIESLTDAETWKEFREIIRERDPSRVRRLGARPAGLVYAIHRSDKPLEPRTLFTFARSALVSASVALNTFGIPLQIVVIP
ncbi:hypothetical protein FCN18_26525 [Prauserella endophytica]|uniref:Sporadically distributed protein, TIGR04141 family n=2 Tax=Prauserella endophytica TaxID=1592324 RepID=A0ABY2S077_9PSEU|nr:hypothetical protein FCN18_26525 [Prauserella endophytica]